MGYLGRILWQVHSSNRLNARTGRRSHTHALTSLGITHWISTTQVDFKQAFRSGKYNVYWISGGAEKLKDKLAEEIREAVNRGDGLLLDGVHDERN
ncbi:MAG: hypothetical protein Q8O38_16250, partial [Sulfurimicrobium sp.]|nr:hypothetical protein [Sulfurimicrobium sp.]